MWRHCIFAMYVFDFALISNNAFVITHTKCTPVTIIYSSMNKSILQNVDLNIKNTKEFLKENSHKSLENFFRAKKRNKRIANLQIFEIPLWVEQWKSHKSHERGTVYLGSTFSPSPRTSSCNLKLNTTFPANNASETRPVALRCWIFTAFSAENIRE